MTSSFGELLAQTNNNEDFGSNWGFEMSKPNNKSSYFQTPFSPPPVSPSSYLAFLDSPIQVSSSNILAPTTNDNLNGQSFKEENTNYSSDFSFPTQTKVATSSSSSYISTNNNSMGEQMKKQEDGWKFTNQTNMQSNGTQQANQIHYTQSNREQRKLDDGYNWRKYGQKQVKGSENPRSYYKCTFPNCPTKKKVETTFDGHITEIVYKGNHNHAKPQTKRSLSSQAYMNQPMGINSEVATQVSFRENAHLDNVTTNQENSSISFGEDDRDQGSMSKSVDEDDNEPEAKRWKGEYDNEAMSALGSRTVREPRIVVQTTSDIDILDDGYRWRKYGQKVVKGNPNPRSYYKCTQVGCPVRKHVERASHDLKAVITTYEGKHNHDVPAPRGSGSYPAPTRPSSDNSNAIAPTVVRPTTNYLNPLQNTRASATNGQAPFTLEMLQGSGSFGFSGVGNSTNTYMNQTQNANGSSFSAAKLEPDDDSFFNSFLG